MNEWKITIPVLRAENRPDGRYLIGEASGPERDTHGTSMAPEAILDFARQIKDRVDAGDPIPYIDSHMDKGVMRELGSVMEGTVTPNFHLMVAVRLDDENPAATFLHGKLLGGKQYGMSIKGDGTEFSRTHDENGRPGIRFTKVQLSEISNTTKPSWVPSFGTVLARSLDSDTTGEAAMADELTPEAAPVVENAAPDESAPAAVENSAADEQTTPEVEAPAVPEDAAPVERARIAKKDSDALMAAFTALGAQLEALGISTAPEPVAAPAPETAPVVENSDTGETDLVELGGISIERTVAEAVTAYVTAEVTRATESLTQTVSTQAEYIKALENLPAGKLPAPVIREKFEKTEIDLSNMTPEQKLRWGLNGIYGNR